MNQEKRKEIENAIELLEDYHTEVIQKERKLEKEKRKISSRIRRLRSKSCIKNGKDEDEGQNVTDTELPD